MGIHLQLCSCPLCRRSVNGKDYHLLQLWLHQPLLVDVEDGAVHRLLQPWRLRPSHLLLRLLALRVELRAA